MSEKITVIIDDGNRLVSWDFSEKATIRNILDDRKYDFVPDTVRINGFIVTEAGMNIPIVSYRQMIDKMFKITCKTKPAKKQVGAVNSAVADGAAEEATA